MQSFWTDGLLTGYAHESEQVINEGLSRWLLPVGWRVGKGQRESCHFKVEWSPVPVWTYDSGKAGATRLQGLSHLGFGDKGRNIEKTMQRRFSSRRRLGIFQFTFGTYNHTAFNLLNWYPFKNSGCDVWQTLTDRQNHFIPSLPRKPTSTLSPSVGFLSLSPFDT